MKTLNLINPLRNTLKHSALALAVAVGLGAGTTHAAAPANDNFADAIDLPGDTGTQTGTTNAEATFQTDEPVCVNPSTTNTVWFKWTCTTTGTWTIDTTGSLTASLGEWDACIAVYKGAALNTLVKVAEQDINPAEILGVRVTAGTTYYLQAGGFNNDVATDIHLAWSFALPVIVDVSGYITNPNIEIGSGNTANMTADMTFGWQTNTCTIPVITNGFKFTLGDGGNGMNYSGDISGAGAFQVDGSGNPTRLTGSAGNSYGGPTTINGVVHLEKSSGDALRGTITVNGGASVVWTAGNQISDASDVTLASTAFLNLAGFPDTINNLTLPAGAKVKTGAGFNGLLRVTNLILDGTTYTTGAFSAVTTPDYVEGSGYILVGGSEPPVLTDPPTAPASPVPTDGTTGLWPIYVTLDWSDSLLVDTYKLYVWPATDLRPETPTATNLTHSEYAFYPTILQNNLAYKWQVVAHNTIGDTEGPEWTFTTRSRSDVMGYLTNPNDDIGIGNTANLIGDTTFGWQTNNCAISVSTNGFTFTLGDGGNGMNFSGDISGVGGFVVEGSGNPTRLTGSVGNTYGGSTLVIGVAQLEKSSGDALRGTITVGGTQTGQTASLVWAAADQINDASNVTLVQTGSLLDLAGFSDTIGNLTMATGTSVATGTDGVLTVYSLTVGGTPQDPGTYTSSFAFVTGSGSVEVLNSPPSIPPVNDNFADAIDLPGDTGTQTGTGTLNATFEAGEPVCKYPETTNTVWFKWTCTQAGVLEISTAGSLVNEWDSVLCIYKGATLGTLLQLVAQDSGGAETVQMLVSPGTYYIQAGGYPNPPPADATDIHLSWAFSLVPTPVTVDVAGNYDNPNSSIGIFNIANMTAATTFGWETGSCWIPVITNGFTFTLDSGNGNDLNYGGAITGTGDVRFRMGPWNDPPTWTTNNPLRLSGEQPNTADGTYYVAQGRVQLEKPDGVAAISGNVIVGGQGSNDCLRWISNDQIVNTANVSLLTSAHGGAYLDLNGHTETIGNLTMATGTSVATGTAGVLTVYSLTVGGTPMPAGTYTSAESAFVTGSGSVEVLNSPPPTPAANDNFADAIGLPGNSGTQTGTGTVDATIETGEPDCGATNTVWFKWTCATTGNFTISTLGSTNLSAGEWDAILGIYTGASVDALTPLPGTPQNIGLPETMTVAVTAGNTYYIQAAGFENAVASNILLNWSWAAPPSGVAVGATGSAVQTFGTRPAATDWSTLTWTGVTGDIINTVGMDDAVQGLIASDISAQVGTSGTNPPSANAIARFNSTLLALQMRPTGVVKGCVLMATLANTSGGGIDQLEIAYDLGMPAAGVESVAGVRAYYSLTGLANSWTVIPEFCTATAGPQSTVVSLSSTWANATAMYVLWVDDTTALTGNDTIYTMIDNVSFAKAGTGALITAFDFGLPAYGSAMIAGTNISIDVPAGTDVSALMPTFTLSNGATCDKVSGGPTTYDFSGTSQTYTVTPLAGSPVAYTVSVNQKSVVDVANALNPPNYVYNSPNTIPGIGSIANMVGVTRFESWGGTWNVSIPVITNGFTFTLNTGGGNLTNYMGYITGTGGLVLNGPALHLGGNIGNTYTGTTTVISAVSLEKSFGNALCGAITMNAGSSLTWAASDQINDASDVTLATGAFLNLAGYKDTINDLYLVTGAQVQTGAGGVLKVARLFINDTQQEEVAYIAGDGYVTGSGYIEVGASGPPVIGTVPAEPATPVPADLATTVHPANLPKLDWADSALAVSYDVYLWLETDTQPTTPTATDVLYSEYTVSPQVLSLSTYKWQVVAKNSVGPTVGPVWTFSTVDRTLVAGNAGQNQTDFNSNLNYIVGVGNSATLLGNFTVAWWGTGGSFSVPVDTNGFILDANTGGGNGGHNASGPISGSGSFVITHGPHTSNAWNNIYTISGATANTYTGGTLLKRGLILLNKTAGIDALPPGTGPIILGSAGETARLQWGANDQINDGAAITVLLPTVSDGFAPDANLNYLDLAGFSDTIAALILPDDGTKTQVRTGTVTGGVLTVTTLTVNGVVMPAGAYTSANSTFVFGLGRVVVAGSGGNTYSTWASDNAGGQTASEDFDNDGVPNGVEYFMGETGSGFTANPSVATAGSVRTVTWPRDPLALASFMVQVSDNLTNWVDIVPPDDSIDETIPTQVTYTLPTGVKQFCRLVVTP